MVHERRFSEGYLSGRVVLRFILEELSNFRHFGRFPTPDPPRYAVLRH
jgi:hypothetical protein